MNDIVERLRTCQGVLTHDPECNCAEAADEIERLRQTAIETMQEMLRRANEIERLCHENMRLLTANEYAFAPVGELSKLNREIERLRDGNRPLPFQRDELGRMVREAWVRWALTHPNPKASWLVPYDKLPEPDKEADRLIGEAIARFTLIGDAARRDREP